MSESKKKYESESESDEESESGYESGSSTSESSSSVKKSKKKKNGKKKKSKSKKRKTKRRGKKKGEPTRARTAYTYFMSAKREYFAGLNPNATFGELAKIMGFYWKNEIKPDEKEKYVKSATDDKERFNREMTEYEKNKKEETSSESSSSAEKGGKKKRKTRKNKDPNKPKRPINSFLAYSRKIRPGVKTDNPDKSNQEIGQIVGAMWKKITDEEKEPFVAEAEKDKERYEEAMKVYNENKEKKAE